MPKKQRGRKVLNINTSKSDASEEDCKDRATPSPPAHRPWAATRLLNTLYATRGLKTDRTLIELTLPGVIAARRRR
eukprot:scaffold53666_cov75-Phaeocystis_antarctica.AAC.6